MEKPDVLEWQPTLDSLGRPLSDVTFVVVDLETTGGSPLQGCAITEIGAVKVRGGEVLGEFKTFVNPNKPIPAFITALTGITDAMVLPAPTIAEVLPAFFEFAGAATETVLVAHNAKFDVSFLKAAASQLKYRWPNYKTLDTVALAKRALASDEVPNRKLSTLSQFFKTEVKPTHRALDDAQTTVEVLHGLLGRLGSRNISTYEDLFDFLAAVTPEQRAKRSLADGLPNLPGVYIFKDAQGEPLYIGTSRNLKVRVRSYFGASEMRSRIKEMLGIAASLDHIICGTVLEAQVRELRMIASKQPRYNRRSRFQEKAYWLTLTSERFPRFSIIRSSENLRDELAWAGPFRGRDDAELASEALLEIAPIRQCLLKITAKSVLTASACALYEMNRCGAPCIDAQSEDEYSSVALQVRSLLLHDYREVESTLNSRMAHLALEERYEEASQIRNRMMSYARGASRAIRIRSYTRIPHLIAAKNDEAGWEFVAVRYGRLVGSIRVKRREDIEESLAALRATSEVVPYGEGILPASTFEEVEIIAQNLESDGVRIVDIDGEWSMPTFGASGLWNKLEEKSSSWQSFTQDD